MKCRVPECEADEWMARQLCEPHWSMLPEGFQLEIRKAVRASGFRRREWLDPIFARAIAFIRETEEANAIAAAVNVFRTRMALVAGVVASIRTLDIDELRDQLQHSSESMLRSLPEDHKAVETRVAMDLEILAVLSDTRIKLGDVIHRYTPPPANPATGHEAPPPPPAGEPKTLDLMEALRASLRGNTAQATEELSQDDIDYEHRARKE